MKKRTKKKQHILNDGWSWISISKGVKIQAFSLQVRKRKEEEKKRTYINVIILETHQGITIIILLSYDLSLYKHLFKKYIL